MGREYPVLVGRYTIVEKKLHMSWLFLSGNTYDMLEIGVVEAIWGLCSLVFCIESDATNGRSL